MGNLERSGEQWSPVGCGEESVGAGESRGRKTKNLPSGSLNKFNL